MSFYKLGHGRPAGEPDSNWSGPKLGWTTYRATSLSSITSFQFASSVSSNGAEAIGVMFMDGQGIGTPAGNALKYFVYTTVAAGFVTVSFSTNQIGRASCRERV